MSDSNNHNTFRNRLLAALPPEEIGRLKPHLELFELTKGDVIYNPGDAISHVYFPERGLVSMLSTTSGGGTIEVGTAGFEGMIGGALALKSTQIPFRAIVQIPGQAWRIRAELLSEEFGHCGATHDLMLLYTNAVLAQVTQSAVCNHFHTSQQRLCRWLLVSLDHSEEDTLPLTQEYIAMILGIQRSRVATITSGLQRQGLISYRWGRLKVLDRAGLEEASCECYRVDKVTTISSLKNYISQFVHA
ncbi:MAG TPA: Crp/Fnr family transcriptional regulator [Blastocatellia bacterium]|nr:Crp/Fnr family transcriptional regulator [Blastocatellia bacterium]